MALRIHQICRPVPSSSSSTASLPSCFVKQSVVSGDIHRFPSMLMSNKKNGNRKGLSSSVTVRSSLETACPTVVVGQVTEVGQDTFWPLVNAAGDKTVVLDMYTQWCGPCKESMQLQEHQQLLEQSWGTKVMGRFIRLDKNSSIRGRIWQFIFHWKESIRSWLWSWPSRNFFLPSGVMVISLIAEVGGGSSNVCEVWKLEFK